MESHWGGARAWQYPGEEAWGPRSHTHAPPPHTHTHNTRACAHACMHIPARMVACFSACSYVALKVSMHMLEPTFAHACKCMNTRRPAYAQRRTCAHTRVRKHAGVNINPQTGWHTQAGSTHTHTYAHAQAIMGCPAKGRGGPRGCMAMREWAHL
eukprot:1155881-Pelagomonas_calceolata.AAC.2